MPTGNEDIKQLEADIRFIRNAMEKGPSLVRQLLVPVRFRVFSIATGIAIIGFCGLLYLIDRIYGSFHGLPDPLKAAVYGLAAGLVVIGLVIQNLDEVKAARRIDPAYSFWTLHRELLRRPVIAHGLLSSLITLGCLIVHFVSTGNSTLIVPATALVLGFNYNLFGAVSELRVYFIPGYWMIASGLFTLAAGDIPVLVSVSGIFGAGLIAFGLAAFLSGRKED
jgi:hypothetical protein